MSAAGALWGLAIGDALGMPTQSLPRPAIVRRYGPVLPGLAPAPPEQPVARGLPAGRVTDDTEQALVLAAVVLAGGGDTELAGRLQAWEDDVRRRGSLDLLGPSTRRALARLEAGEDPSTTGRDATTNGAAMRVAPVGIATRPEPLGRLVDRVVAASRVTHNTGITLAGAAAVAAAVSAGLDGASAIEATALAGRAADAASGRGHWIAGADVAARIRWAAGIAAGTTPEELAHLAATLIGTSVAVQESVPAAFAVLAAVPDDPWLACRLAASLGGDTDTIAAMVGAVAGACFGVDAFPADARAAVAAANPGLDLDATAAALLARRQ